MRLQDDPCPSDIFLTFWWLTLVSSFRFNCTLSIIPSVEYHLKVNDEKFGEILFCEIYTDEVLGNTPVVTSFCYSKYLHDLLFCMCVTNNRSLCPIYWKLEQRNVWAALHWWFWVKCCLKSCVSRNVFEQPLHVIFWYFGDVSVNV